MSNSHNQQIIHNLAQGRTTYRCQHNLTRYAFDIINNLWKNTGGLQSSPEYLSSIRKLDECLSSLEGFIHTFHQERHIREAKIFEYEKEFYLIIIRF